MRKLIEILFAASIVGSAHAEKVDTGAVSGQALALPERF